MTAKTKRRFTFAPLAMVCAPLALVAFTLWASRRQTFIESRPPANWTTGVPRAEANGWRALAVSGAEVGRGLTAKVECDLWAMGVLPVAGRAWRSAPFVDTVRSNAYLTYRQGRRTRRLVLPDGTGGIRIAPTFETLTRVPKSAGTREVNYGRKAQLLLPMGFLPANAGDITLHGSLVLRWMENGRPAGPIPASMKKYLLRQSGFWLFHVKTKPFKVKLAALPSWATKPGPATEEPAAPKVEVLQASAKNVARSPWSSRQGGDALVELHLRVPQPLLSRSILRPRIIESRVVDAAGRTYLPGSYEMQDPELNCLRGGMTYGGSLPKGEFTCQDEVPLWRVPASAGPLTLKIWISTENRDTPVLVEREVRPVWLTRRAASLKVESARFSIASGTTGGESWSGRPVVDVTLSYQGNKTLIARGFLARPNSDGPQWDPTMIYLSREFKGFGASIVRPAPGEAELLLDWSQRLTDSKESSTLFGSSGPQALASEIQTEEPRKYENGRRWKVRYYIKSLPRSNAKKRLWFRAEIGIAGEGFVPVSCPVTLD